MYKLKLIIKLAKSWLWQKDLIIKGGSWLFVIIVAIAISVEIWGHQGGHRIPTAWDASTVTVFYNVPDILLADVKTSLATQLVYLSIAKVLFIILVGIADIVFYRKVTGQRFDWNGMINFTIINAIFLSLTLLPLTSPFASLITVYDNLVQRIPSIVQLDGWIALLIACTIGDFCYYWSHRWSHNIRFFWNLGHINHHRSQYLTQMTHAVDPQFGILDVAGGKAFVLVLLPLMARLFTTDIQGAGRALVGIMCVDILVDPSHSTALYYIESRLYKSRKTRLLVKALRYLFVTTNIHFTHHSREKRHDIRNGCNFGARVTLWDRCFGTYCEPPLKPPKTGLYGKPDYCGTPLRFIFSPWVRMTKELYRNKWRYWPKILFGPTSYTPPVEVKGKY
jgi:sterol desaturase/sphingolipid hydroxylase (fatty acid hydroxylase superfamily)